MGDDKTDIAENVSSLNKFYHEFYPLIPGTLFFGCLTALLLGFYSLYKGEFPANRFLIESNWPLFAIVALFWLFGAYIAGNIFNRLSPKDPDIFGIYHHNRQRYDETIQGQKSLFDLMAKLPPDCLNTAKYSELSNIFKLGFFTFRATKFRKKIDPEMRMQFPYPHLRAFFYQQNHGELCDYVPWCWLKEDIGDCRQFYGTKQTINSLKHRILEINDPDVNLKLVQTECQVRLMTSMWHVLRIIHIPALLFIGAAVASVLIKVVRYFICHGQDVALIRQASNLVAHTHEIFGEATKSNVIATNFCPILTNYLSQVTNFCSYATNTLIQATNFCSSASSNFGDCSKNLSWEHILKDITNAILPASSLSSCLVVVLLSFYGIYLFYRAKYEIEYSVHYMRCREVFDIIDFAHVLSIKENNVIRQKGKKVNKALSSRFESVKQRGKDFYNDHCAKCVLNGWTCPNVAPKEEMTS